MSLFTELPPKDRISLLQTCGQATGLPASSIEKDWWVTMVLRALFLCDCQQSMVFKGGTSLSKGWHLIERFSEDIDLAIDRSFFGFEGELSRKSISQLRRASCTYIKAELRKQLDHNLRKAGINNYVIVVPESSDTTVDPQIIEVNYESLLPQDKYIADKIIIEIGSRSLIEPSERIKMRSIIADVFYEQDFADHYHDVPTVVPQKTFLEKAFLLHEEFQKPTNNIRHERMSRHLYDLEKLMDTQFGREALNNYHLYQTIVEHRRKLTSISGVDYNTHAPSTIAFIPPIEVINEWKLDYASMQESMIYGDSLSFDKLIARIIELNERFRKIKPI